MRRDAVFAPHSLWRGNERSGTSAHEDRIGPARPAHIREAGSRQVVDGMHHDRHHQDPASPCRRRPRPPMNLRSGAFEAPVAAHRSMINLSRESVNQSRKGAVFSERDRGPCNFSPGWPFRSTKPELPARRFRRRPKDRTVWRGAPQLRQERSQVRSAGIRMAGPGTAASLRPEENHRARSCSRPPP